MPTYSPTYPLAGEEVTVFTTVNRTVDSEISHDLTIDEPELTIVSVPPDSALETGDVLDPSTGLPTNRFTPDVAGEYAVTVQSYREFFCAPTQPGGFSGYRKALLSSSSMTVNVGETMVLPIVVTRDHAMTLTLGVFGGAVRTAALSDATSEKAYAATQDTTVQTKLVDLENRVVTSLGPSLATVVADAIAQFNDHRTQATVHPANDTLNVYVADRPYDQADAIRQLNELCDRFTAHLLNASAATSAWHTDDDTKNVLIAGPATDLPTAMVRWADLRRCFTAHLGQISAPASHSNADAVNTLAAVDKLTDLLSTIIAFIANASPTVPTGIEDGVVQLQSLYGFRRSAA